MPPRPIWWVQKSLGFTLIHLGQWSTSKSRRSSSNYPVATQFKAPEYLWNQLFKICLDNQLGPNISFDLYLGRIYQPTHGYSTATFHWKKSSYVPRNIRFWSFLHQPFWIFTPELGTLHSIQKKWYPCDFGQKKHDSSWSILIDYLEFWAPQLEKLPLLVERDPLKLIGLPIIWVAWYNQEAHHRLHGPSRFQQICKILREGWSQILGISLSWRFQNHAEIILWNTRAFQETEKYAKTHGHL